MPQRNIDPEVRACIDSFVQELSSLVRQAALESVLDALGGTATPAKRGPGRPRKTASKPTAKKSTGPKKRGRRSSADVAETVASAAAFVGANPGCSVSEIGAALGLSTKDLRLPLLKLVSDKKIKTKGQKRGTRYHPGAGGAPRKAGKKRAKRAAKKTAKKKAGGRRKATR